jgi:RNA polymerase sigma factor (TIGR02999 family)
VDLCYLCAFMAAPPNLSAEALMPLVYEELRALAGRYFRDAMGLEVAPTSIVHEAFVKLSEARSPAWKDEQHFAAIAATAMRQILVDRARRQRAAKRGGGWERVTLSIAIDGVVGRLDLEGLDDALTELAALDGRQARIVELRFFGGLTVPQVSGVLEVSSSTVEKEWRRARAWLGARLKGDG